MHIKFIDINVKEKDYSAKKYFYYFFYSSHLCLSLSSTKQS